MPSMLRRPTLLVLAFLPLATAVHAAPAVSCHCFRDRSFDPEAPFAADEYVLATAQNSLLAAVYGVPRKDVVRAKMTGTPGAALWVAHEVGRRSGQAAAVLLSERAAEGSWGKVFQGIPADVLGEPLRDAAARTDADASLASEVVNEVLQTRLGLDPGAVNALTAAGGSPAERIAATLLHRLRQGDPAELLKRVRSGDASWGALFHGAGVEPEAIDEAIPPLLR